jgi:proteasome activator subunit 4
MYGNLYISFSFIFILFAVFMNSLLMNVLLLQALKMVSKFVRSTVLPGAANEIGSLCRAAVYANPEMSVEVLLVPLMHSVVSSLAESPSTGFSGDGVRTEGADFKVGLLSIL